MLQHMDEVVRSGDYMTELGNWVEVFGKGVFVIHTYTPIYDA
jgi:hypothetical protein